MSAEGERRGRVFSTERDKIIDVLRAENEALREVAAAAEALLDETGSASLCGSTRLEGALIAWHQKKGT